MWETPRWTLPDKYGVKLPSKTGFEGGCGNSPEKIRITGRQRGHLVS